MNKNNSIRNALTQLTGQLSDTGFAALVSAFNLTAGLSLSLAQAVTKGLLQGVMQNCYDDIVNRSLSEREVAKHNDVFEIAARTFLELAEKDNVSTMFITSDDSELRYAYEVAEHISIEAIRQSELKKIEILGHFYGGQFYKKQLDWQDMHQIINMAGALTLRQIIMIRLICEGFPGLESDSFITNPSACVEINRLLDYGIWQVEGATFGTNNSIEIQLGSLQATDYAKMVNDTLMLDKLTKEDIQRVIDSLWLKNEGKKPDRVTIEEYRDSTEWAVVDENGHRGINAGNY